MAISVSKISDLPEDMSDLKEAVAANTNTMSSFSAVPDQIKTIQSTQSDSLLKLGSLISVPKSIESVVAEQGKFGEDLSVLKGVPAELKEIRDNQHALNLKLATLDSSLLANLTEAVGKLDVLTADEIAKALEDRDQPLDKNIDRMTTLLAGMGDAIRDIRAATSINTDGSVPVWVILNSDNYELALSKGLKGAFVFRVRQERLFPKEKLLGKSVIKVGNPYLADAEWAHTKSVLPAKVAFSENGITPLDPRSLKGFGLPSFVIVTPDELSLPEAMRAIRGDLPLGRLMFAALLLKRD